MSFLMLLQIPLKYLQLCKNSPTIFSGTYKSFICCVNNNGGSKNRLWKLTLRLRGLQGRCGSTLASDPNTRRVETTSSSSSLLCSCCWPRPYIADTVKLKLRVDYYGDWCRCLVWLEFRCTLDNLQWPWPRLWCVWDLVQCTWVWVRSAWIQLQCPGIFLQSERIIQRVGL